MRKVESGILEDGDEIGETLHHLLAAAELVGIVEVRHVGQLVRLSERSENLLVDLIADVGFALQRDHVGKAGAFGNADGRVGLVGVAVTDVFHEQEHKDIVLVLAGIHAAAQFIAACPERRVKFGFLECHVLDAEKIHEGWLNALFEFRNILHAAIRVHRIPNPRFD